MISETADKMAFCCGPHAFQDMAKIKHFTDVRQASADMTLAVAC